MMCQAFVRLSFSGLCALVLLGAAVLVPTQLMAADAPAAAPVAADSPAPAAAPTAATAAASAADAAAAMAKKDLNTLWQDFVHYVLVYNDELAAANGKALLDKTDGAQLLAVLEGSINKDDFDRILERAAKSSAAVKAVAVEMAGRVDGARNARARDPKQIQADIEALARGGRPQQAALARLRSAGQAALPALLAVVENDQLSQLHSHALTALTIIGRPAVYPLSLALIDLEPRAQIQIARVLTEIGYPRALPFLKLAHDASRASAEVKAAMMMAINQIASTTNVDKSVPTAQLLLILGEEFYADVTMSPQELPGYDQAAGHGQVWVYRKGTGLAAMEVPLAIHGDVLAMRTAELALSADKSLDAALSLWLKANLRRANNLPKDANDPTYSQTMRAPEYYLRMAGSARQSDVLRQALADRDAVLALDAIDALSTAGADPASPGAATMSLVEGLYYPDRRIRFAAAFALSAGPRLSSPEYPGSFRVVPVLAEAVRQSARRSVLVIGPADSHGELKTALPDGLNTDGALSIQDAQSLLGSKPGFDLIVIKAGVEEAYSVIHQTAEDYRLRAVPVIALLSDADATELRRRYDHSGRLMKAVTKAAEIRAAATELLRSFGGGALNEEQTQAQSAAALSRLYEIALAHGEAFRVSDAIGVLLDTAKDNRPAVSLQAVTVLALINHEDAQRAIADVALDAARPAEARVALLTNLAASASAFGNHLNPSQVTKLQDQLAAAEGELAVALSRVYGALSLPTANVVKWIMK